MGFERNDVVFKNRLREALNEENTMGFEHNDIVTVDVMNKAIAEGGGGGDRLARRIHKGGGLHQEDAYPTERRLTDKGVVTDAVDPHAEALGEIVQRQKARVVAGVLIVLTGIAEARHDHRHRGGAFLGLAPDLFEKLENICHACFSFPFPCPF